MTGRLGVVLAGGGFNDNPVFREELLPPECTQSPRSGTSLGELQQMAIALGARFSNTIRSAAFWAPVSVGTANGGTAVFPHFVLDRAKPGHGCRKCQGQPVCQRKHVLSLLRGGDVEARFRQRFQRSVAYLIADRRALVSMAWEWCAPAGAELRVGLATGT